jgi:hypothetical protein
MKEITDRTNVPISATLFLNLALGGGGFLVPQFDSWLKVFVRMTDLASDEYEKAAYYWKFQYTPRTDGTWPMTLPLAGDHLELCLLSLFRAIRCLLFLTQGKGDKLASIIDIETVQLYVKRYRKVRNTIAHIDERIDKQLGANAPHTMRIDQSGKTADIHHHVVDLDDLHECLMRLREVARKLSRFKELESPSQ